MLGFHYAGVSLCWGIVTLGCRYAGVSLRWGVVMLGCRYAECHHAECRGAVVISRQTCNVAEKKFYKIGSEDNRLQRRHNQPNGKETSFTITELVTFLLKPFSLIDPKCLSSTIFSRLV